MATRGNYFPVESEDISNSRLLEDNPTSPDDTARSWDNGDEKRPRKLMSMWTFSLLIIGLSVMFLVGVCVGFYVRELQKSLPDVEEICGDKKKKQGVDYDRLGALHESLVYYIRGEEIREFVSKFGTEDPVTGSRKERELAEEVLEKFNKFRIGSVDTEEYEAVVTTSDPDNPNRLEVLGYNRAKSLDMVLTNSRNDKSNSSQSSSSSTLTNGWKHPHVAFSPAGDVQGSLVYAHYGQETDFTILKALGAEVADRIVLLRMGKLSVAEKIRNCEENGVRGVILYWEPNDVKHEVDAPKDATFIPFASAASYSADIPTFWRPSIICQTISSEQAKVLISLLADSNNSISAPPSWQGSHATSYFIGGQKSGGVMIHLSVFNVPSKLRIQNIISKIQGTEEPDRYVIVGAPRSSLPGQSQDVVASTSVLVQLFQGIHFINKQHLWRPRRSIKLISWGAAEFSNIGKLHHIKSHHHLLERRGVAYFDLSQLAVGNSTVVASLPPSLHRLIKESTFDVSDPNNPDQTLQISWKLMMEQGSNSSSQQEIIPLDNRHTDSSSHPFLHVSGVPEVRLQYRASTGSQNSVAEMTRQDLAHHYKYHVTVMHILVKGVLALLDYEVLPLNLQHAASSIQDTVLTTWDVLEECSPNMRDPHPVQLLCTDLMTSAGALQEVTDMFIKKRDHQGIRMVNDMKMLFEKTFILHRNGQSKHILYPARHDGSLLHAAELCEMAQALQLWNVTTEFEGELLTVMKQTLGLFFISG